jgi:hypothetical protein
MRALCLACLALLSAPAHGPARQPGEGVWGWG